MIVAVIGLGTFGAKTAVRLFEKGAEVIAIDKDGSVCQTVKEEFKRLQNDPFFEEMVFANGGDRKEGGVPEDVLEEELGVRMIYNTVGDKVQSSSNLIKKAEVFSEK